MDSIPNEILHLIFIKLDLKDKFKCTRVCRSWYTILDHQSLLNDLELEHWEYDGFLEMIKCLPHRATQVEYLTLNNCFTNDSNKRELCNKFPNLRQLVMSQNYLVTIKDDTFENFHFIHPTKLERLEDFGKCELARQLSMSNTCQQLKVLELNMFHAPQLLTNIVSQLINMPVLECLSIYVAKLSLMDLETIHGNIPTIENFVLYQVDLSPGKFPLNVTPATLVTKLDTDIRRVEDIHTHIQFYKYMSMKYPSVSHFGQIDTVMDRSGLDYCRQVYNEGIFSFLRTIGSHCDTYCLRNYCNGLDAFRKFDAFGSKLKELTIQSSHDDDSVFLEELVQSQQSKYICKLSLIDIIPQPEIMMHSMEALETLYINCANCIDFSNRTYRKHINFGQLLKSCQETLTELSLIYVDLQLNDSTSNLTRIKYLSLNRVDLTPALAKIIETSFPDLLTLELFGYIKSSLTLALPDHNLEKVDILTSYGVGRRNGFSARTTCDDKIQYYSERRTQDDNNDVLHATGNLFPIAKEDFDDALIFSFVCSSVKALNLATRAYIDIDYDDYDD